MAAAKTGRVNYDKGLDLEMRFCEFMKTELGYSEAIVGTTQHSSNNASGIKLDIMAKKNSQLGKWLMGISVTFSCFTIVCVIGLVAYCYYNDIELNKSIIFIATITEVLALTFYVLSKKHTTEFAWVECKDWERKVAIKDIEKMFFEYESNKGSRDKKHRFRHKYFVSANGFVHNAQVYAEKKGIICYICSDNEFIRTELP